MRARVERGGGQERATVVAKARGGVSQPAAVPSAVYEVLREPGEPMEVPARMAAEQQLGLDFSAVRMHRDARAAESAAALQARAYSVGSHVVFGAGQYAPQTAEGGELLRHELAASTTRTEQSPRLGVTTRVQSLRGPAAASVGQSDTIKGRSEAARSLPVQAELAVSTPDDAALQFEGRSAPEPTSAAQVHRLAASGLIGPATALPHLAPIQRAFGRHGVGLERVASHVGGPAAAASRALGAGAYTCGGAVAFAAPPPLHTAAHEAAHVIQQRGGVRLPGGLGAHGDAHERQAERVADAVVAGRSAEELLTPAAAGTGRHEAPAVQRTTEGVEEAVDAAAPVRRLPSELSAKEREVLKAAVANERFKNQVNDEPTGSSAYPGLSFLTDLIAYMRRNAIEADPKKYQEFKASVESARMYSAAGNRLDPLIRTFFKPKEGQLAQGQDWNIIYVGAIIPFLKEELPKLYADRYKALDVDPKLQSVFDASKKALGTEYSQDPLDEMWKRPKDDNGEILPIDRAPPLDCSGFIRQVFSGLDKGLSATGNVSSEYIHFAAHPEIYAFVKGVRYAPILDAGGVVIRVAGGVLAGREPEVYSGADIQAGDIAITGSRPKYDLKDVPARDRAKLPGALQARTDLAVLSTDFKHITLMTGRKTKSGEYETIEASDVGTITGFFSQKSSHIHVLIRVGGAVKLPK